MTLDGVGPDNTITGDLTELVRETAPELLAPDRAPIRRRRSIALAAVAVGAAAVALLVSFRTLADPVAGSGAKADYVCAVVLGLNASQAPYQECLASLSRNVPGNPQAMAVKDRRPQTTRQKAAAACAEIGLETGSVAFDRCVTDLDQSLWAQQMLYR